MASHPIHRRLRAMFSGIIPESRMGGSGSGVRVKAGVDFFFDQLESESESESTFFRHRSRSQNFCPESEPESRLVESVHDSMPKKVSKVIMTQSQIWPITTGVRPGVGVKVARVGVGIRVNLFLATGVGVGIGVIKLARSRSRDLPEPPIFVPNRIQFIDPQAYIPKGLHSFRYFPYENTIVLCSCIYMHFAW